MAVQKYPFTLYLGKILDTFTQQNNLSHKILDDVSSVVSNNWNLERIRFIDDKIAAGVQYFFCLLYGQSIWVNNLRTSDKCIL